MFVACQFITAGVNSFVVVYGYRVIELMKGCMSFSIDFVSFIGDACAISRNLF